MTRLAGPQLDSAMSYFQGGYRRGNEERESRDYNAQNLNHCIGAISLEAHPHIGQLTDSPATLPLMLTNTWSAHCTFDVHNAQMLLNSLPNMPPDPCPQCSCRTQVLPNTVVRSAGGNGDFGALHAHWLEPTLHMHENNNLPTAQKCTTLHLKKTQMRHSFRMKHHNSKIQL